MAEPSLGEGIGLQQGANRDDYWAKQIYARGVERKAAREKADEDLIKDADFKKDFSKTLPYYANKMAAIQKDIGNKIVAARQSNKNTARSVVANDLYNARLEMGRLEQDNARAMAAIADKNATIPPEYLKIMTSPNTTDEEWASMHDGQFFMTDNTGTFAYRGYVEPDLGSKVDYGKYNAVGYPTGKYEIRGNQRYQELKDSYDENADKRTALTIAQLPEFETKVRWDTKGWKQDPNETTADFTNRKLKYADELSLKIAQKNRPPDALRLADYTIPQAPASDKKDEPLDLRTLAQFDIASKVIDVANGGKSTNTTVPIQINLPEKINPTVIPTGIDVLDVETNKQVSENPTNLSFTPSTLQYKNITRTKNGVKTKRNEWYVLGTAIDIAKANEAGVVQPTQTEGESDEAFKNRMRTFMITQAKASEGQKPGSKKTTFNVMVPLASVRGALKGVTQSQLDELASEYDGKQSTEPVKMILVEIDGKTGEVPSDKLDAFRKKYPNAKIK